MGAWPTGIFFDKTDIDIQFFLYARKIRGEYNGLKDEYTYSMILDVEEGAVYCGSS